MSEAYIYDIETLRSCSVFVFLHYKVPEEKVFVIHELRNDFTELMNFLENCADNPDTLIGFNNLSFDGQIIQALLKNRAQLEKLSPEVIANKIYQKAQTLINEQDFSGRANGTPEWQLSIPQIDVFTLNHWDNPARRSSLKWLQFTCNWPHVLDMPIHHSTKVTSMDQIDEIIGYCSNDVQFTKYLYERSKPMLKIRQGIQKKYKLNCLSYSNTKLGSELLLKLYCKKTKKKKYDVKQLSTKRPEIKVKDIIFPFIKFQSGTFERLLDSFKNLVITGTKGEFKELVNFEGVKYTYALGGIHAITTPGVYKSDDKYIIKDCDVASLYPSIGISNNMYPAHLGIEFTEVYRDDIVNVRLKEKAKGKAGDKSIVDGFKEAANASYGNSNQKHSWLYDPLYTMQTTINSQLMLTSLCEAITLGLTNVQILQANTDGISTRLLRSEENKYLQICKDWEVTNKVQLEHIDIEQMLLWDINNYVATYKDKKPKFKGRFQTEYEWNEVHKNKSFLVVPKGIYEFFVNGVFPEEYIKTNRNIFDYCGGARAVGDWNFVQQCMSEGILTETPVQKTMRFYVSKEGCKIIKVNKTDGRRINVVAGQWLLTEYNSHKEIPWEDYNIDEKFYIEQIRKEINTLQTKATNQLSLF